MEKLMQIIEKRYESARADVHSCYIHESEARVADGSWYLGVCPGTYNMISIIAELKEVDMRKAAMVVLLTCFEDIDK